MKKNLMLVLISILLIVLYIMSIEKIVASEIPLWLKVMLLK